MQPSILTRIVRVYLLLVSIVAVFSGFFFLVVPHSISLFALFARFLVYIFPLPSFFWKSYFLFTDTAVLPIIPYPIVATLVTGWGVLGIFALARARRNIRWIYVWYGLSAAAALGNAYDVAITAGTGFYTLSGVVASAVLALATFVLHEGLRRVRSGSAGTNGSNAGSRFM